MNAPGGKGLLISALGRPASPWRHFALRTATLTACLSIAVALRAAAVSGLIAIPVALVAIVLATRWLAAFDPQMLQVRSTGSEGLRVHGIFRGRTLRREQEARLERVRLDEDGSLALTLTGIEGDLVLDRSAFTERHLRILSRLLEAALGTVAGANAAISAAVFATVSAETGLKPRDANGHDWFQIAERPSGMGLSFASLIAAFVIVTTASFALRSAAG